MINNNPAYFRYDLCVIICMRRQNIALPVYNGRIAPLFDVARCFLCVAVEGNTVGKPEYLETGNLCVMENIELLRRQNVGVIICSAISRVYATAVQNAGIQLVHGIIGPVDEIIAVYAKNEAQLWEYRMPGCCGRGGRQGRRGRCIKGNTTNSE